MRKTEKTKLVKPNIKIPDTWTWAPILKISQLVVDCHNKTAPYVDSGIPLIRTTNIRNAKIDLSNTKYVTKDTYLFWSKRCVPVSGDILFTREAHVVTLHALCHRLQVPVARSVHWSFRA